MLFTDEIFLICVSAYICKSTFANNEPDFRIMGGSDADIKNYPYTVAIHLKAPTRIFICTGALIRKEWVLSAASCFDEPDRNVSNLEIRVGSNFSITEGITYQIISLFKHEKYQPGTSNANDIALLRSNVKAVFSQPIKMAREKHYFQPGFDCDFTGYGYTKSPAEDEKPQRLRYLKTPLLEHAPCQLQYLKLYSNDTMICAGFVKNRASPCEGDLGGPLVCDGLLYGIHVLHSNKCETQGPAAFVMVAAQRKWIKKMAKRVKFED